MVRVVVEGVVAVEKVVVEGLGSGVLAGSARVVEVVVDIGPTPQRGPSGRRWSRRRAGRIRFCPSTSPCCPSARHTSERHRERCSSPS